MECECGCGERSLIKDMNDLERMVHSLTQNRRTGKAMGRIFVTKRNQQGEIKIRREIPVPHPTEALEKQMANYYTQSFPLEPHTMVRSFLETLHSWQRSDHCYMCLLSATEIC